MTKLALKVLGNMAAFYLAVQLFPAIRVDRPETFLWAGLILGLINLIIRPVLLFVSLPISLITLGLFTVLIDTWMVMLTDAVLPGLSIPGFWLTVVTALIVAGCNLLLTALTDKK